MPPNHDREQRLQFIRNRAEEGAAAQEDVRWLLSELEQAEAELLATQKNQEERELGLHIGFGKRLENAQALLARERERADRLESDLEDIASGDWKRYPNSERHGQVPTGVEGFARWVLAGLRAERQKAE